MISRNPNTSLPQKIVIVDNSTWNIFNFRLPLIKRLKAAGCQIVVAAPLDEFIHYLNDSYFTRHIPLRYLDPQGNNPFNDLLAIWELCAIYQREKPDLILHYTIKPNVLGNIAAKLAGKPSFSVVTGLGYPFLHKSFASRIAPLLYRLAFKFVEKVIFYNPDDRTLFLKKKLVDRHKTVIIQSSGVNTNHFRPLPKPDDHTFVFLFIGRLLYDKGLAEYVEAAKEVRAVEPRAECWVVGPFFSGNPSAVQKEVMLKWVQEKHIRYFGEVNDVRKYIKQADVMVLPTYREGVPRSVLEAMAMGKPIVTTSTAGAKETVRHGENGLLVPVKNAPALAEAMLSLMRMKPNLLEEMGKQSRKIALRKFDDRVIAEKFISVIQDFSIPEFEDYPEPEFIYD